MFAGFDGDNVTAGMIACMWVRSGSLNFDHLQSIILPYSWSTLCMQRGCRGCQGERELWESPGIRGKSRVRL